MGLQAMGLQAVGLQAVGLQAVGLQAMQSQSEATWRLTMKPLRTIFVATTTPKEARPTMVMSKGIKTEEVRITLLADTLEPITHPMSMPDPTMERVRELPSETFIPSTG
ncbi:hypothetical protein GNI_065800 [Gregarina niphandrodes]|uniref:Uncharacterized protein n=1 Tax=Gregarina niphandrodes TaxID=110365 RepID=A0A023B7X6_GRENI|nr:hypothetical protein GNI_065800 [Gregarina niphandrodes]EZG67897.1 hypothetical protein GNI_065800 [Gregarina niphandrodes]|eukprot:XP_011130145.1 hypothetical protein GNI_065800 [Gregarina niphandrodes]